MKNPTGPYPGRQLFIGRTEAGNPSIAYLVTGRSPASRERRAVTIENGVRIGPLGDTPYDPLRHYNVVKYDDTSGMIVVTNGIQTESIFETYKLLYNVGTQPTKDYMEKIMAAAAAEPDNLLTPRIAGAVIPKSNGVDHAYIIGIVTAERAASFQVKPEPGKFYGVSTYHGNLDSPGAFDINAGPIELKLKGTNASDITKQLFEISEASYQGDDIRVCALGGMLSGIIWNFSIINTNKE
jgi:IMP cyclohydrolase